MNTTKKTAMILAAMVCCTSMPFMTAQARQSSVWGDATGDGSVTVEDAQDILKFYTTVVVAGREDYTDPIDTDMSDVNGDGEISVEDAQLVLKKYTEVTVAGNQYLLPVELIAQKDSEDTRVLCNAPEGWYLWSEASNAVSAHIVDVVRTGELFQIIAKNGYWYKVQLPSGKEGYMMVSDFEFDKFFVVYERKTEAATTTTTTAVETTTTKVATTTKAEVSKTTTTVAAATTTKAAATTTKPAALLTTEKKTATTAALTTTTAKQTTSTAPVTTTAAPKTTTTAVSTTTKGETTTTTEKVVTVTTAPVTSTEAIATTTTNYYETLPMESLKVGDIIVFKMTCWKVFEDKTMERVIAWMPYDSVFLIKEVVQKFDDGSEIYRVNYTKNNEVYEGFMFNGRQGYFKVLDHKVLEEPEFFEVIPLD